MLTWFKNRKISAKLIIGFVIVAIIAGVVGVIGIASMFSLNHAGTLLYEVNTLGTNYAGTASEYYQRIRYNAVEAILMEGTTQQDDCIKKIQDYSAIVDESLANYEGTIITDDNQQIIDALKPQWDQYKSTMNEAIEYLQSNNIVKAKKVILSDLASIGNNLEDAFEKMIAFNTEAGDERSTQNDQLAATSTITMIAVVVIGIALALVLGIAISRIISKPVKKMVDAAKLLAEGDVNVVVDINTKDEVGDLAKAFKSLVTATKEQAYITQRLADGDLTADISARSENDLLGKSIIELLDKLNHIVETIVLAAEQVSSGAGLVANSSAELSQGATEQASSVEELTASLEEIASQTIQNAENARTASNLVKDAESNAVDGNIQMQGMLRAMTEINESSKNINKIIKVIDDIAFQTNILALNAAVEAARAGQHGKGFAVVAEEVRNLAAKSAEAVKETTGLIEDSIKKVEAGTRLANSTAEALNKIVNQVKEAAELVNSIAVASSEQSSGVEQVNQGIMQISQVVQSNAASSEESAAASEELSSQAEQLKDIVSVFKLKRTVTRELTESEPAQALPAKEAVKANISLDAGDFGKY